MTLRESKRRKVGHVNGKASAGPSDAKLQKSFIRSAAGWDLEQDYEQRQRKNKSKEKESNRLPIKTADGRVQQLRALEAEHPASDSDEDGDWSADDDDDANNNTDAETLKREHLAKQKKAQDDAPKIPERQQILQAKESLAKIAMAVNEEPEENIGAFKQLAEIGKSPLESIRKLTIATQMAVYKDVIPGYRIRPVSEDAPVEKLSKEVRKLKSWEQALVAGYQAYIKDLLRYAKTEPTGRRGAGQSISSVAIACTCTLLLAVPHFNFRGELIKIIVGKLSRKKVDADFVRCLQTVQTMFHDDEEGRPSLEMVSLLAKMMRAREYEVDESVVNLFLHLRLLTELSAKLAHEDDSNNAPDGPKPKKQQREFRNKKERKALKEQKEIEKQMAHADAAVSHEERDRLQSDMLKVVFAAYFRILKQRVPHLMGAVLEGLAKYAHLINQDLFGDLLEALKDLIRYSINDAEASGENDEDDDENNKAADSEDEEQGFMSDDDDDDDDFAHQEALTRNLSREALLCTITAFALLAGQDAHNSRSTLHLDLTFFITHLYKTLLPLATRTDLEITARTPHLRAPAAVAEAAAATGKVNAQTTTVLLVRCLTAVLLPRWNIRSVAPLRLAAFSKQLMTTATHLPERSCQAVLALMGDVAHSHGKKIASLWNTEERKGDGAFIPLSETVEGSNPFAATVWEGEILRKHYSPKVREGVALLEKSISSVRG